MAAPRLKAYIAFGSSYAVPSPSWTDVSNRLRTLSTRRGRQSQLDRVEAGTANFVLDNRDGWLTPMNGASPYYPYVIPRRQVKFEAEHETGTYPIFRGYIRSITPSSGEGNADSVVAVEAADAFMLLRGRTYTGATTAETSDSRINTLLAGIAWPYALMDLGTGSTTVSAYTYSNANLLQACQEAEAAELGTFFASRDGKLTFQGRHYRATASIGYTFDCKTGIPYSSVTFDYSDDGVFNAITCSALDAAGYTETDSTSISAYGRSELDRTRLLFSDPTEADLQALFLLGQYKDPLLRVRSMTCIGRGDEPDLTTRELWQAMLDLDISDAITVVRREPGFFTAGADRINADLHVESINVDVSQDRIWQVTFGTSNSLIRNMWALGRSKLGRTTQLGY